MPVYVRNIQTRRVKCIVDAPHSGTEDIAHAGQALARNGVRLAHDIRQAFRHRVRRSIFVVAHSVYQCGAVHEIARERGLDGPACRTKVVVRAPCFCEIVGVDAQVYGGLRCPGCVLANGAGGDEGACLEDFKVFARENAAGDGGCARDPFGDILGD